MNFLDLGLSDKTVKAIEELGINEPRTVQNDVIPSILAGKDVFTIAPQCCGKTCSYVFPLLDVPHKCTIKGVMLSIEINGLAKLATVNK